MQLQCDWLEYTPAYTPHTPNYIQRMLAQLTIDKPHDHYSIIFLSSISSPTLNLKMSPSVPEAFVNKSHLML